MQGNVKFADLPIGMAFYLPGSAALVKISQQFGAELLDSRSGEAPIATLSPVPAAAEVIVAGIEAF